MNFCENTKKGKTWAYSGFGGKQGMQVTHLHIAQCKRPWLSFLESTGLNEKGGKDFLLVSLPWKYVSPHCLL